jgi:gliding motility-associated-like protein
MVTPNNDGINDTWQLPQEYTVGNDVEVLIVSPVGEVVIRTKEYNNNWPESGTSSKETYPVYYYIISPPNGALKKGTITIVR